MMEARRSAKQNFFLILILGALTTLGPFSIDMYLPGFPAIAEDLHTPVANVALSLSSFFIGISIGQLLYGPLLDRFGRKKPLYIGLALYFVSSLGCIAARNIDALVILRFIQAIGSCAAAVAAVAMVRDLFPVKDTAKVLSLLMLVVGASPMVAPTVGGYVTAAFGWQAVFVILAVMGLLMLGASVFFLAESYEPDSSLSLKPKPIMFNFWSVFREPQFYTYALSGTVAFAGLFAYVSGSPIVFLDYFQVSGKVYGWIFAGLSVGFIGSSQINTLLLRKYKSEQITLMAMICLTLTGAVLVTGTAYGLFGLGAIISLIFVFLCCIGLVNPNACALALAPFSKQAGSAAALLGALQTGMGALASVGVSMFKMNTALPMAAIMAGSALLALFILLIGRRKVTVTPDILSLQPEIILH